MCIVRRQEAWMTSSAEWIGSLSRRGHWTPAEAQRLLDAIERSGESTAAFARRHGIRARRITWWKARLSRTPPGTVTLVPVTVRSTAPTTAAAALFVGDVRVELDPARVAPAWVAAVAAALTRDAT
jgi:transposase-like protein